MYTQNYQVENTPSIIIHCGDIRISKWRRQILTGLSNGKLNGKLIKIRKNILI